MFFEETTSALSLAMGAGSSKYRVLEKKAGVKYTLEIMVNPSLGVYDHKVTCTLHDGFIFFTGETIAEKHPGQLESKLAGSDTASINVDADTLALAIKMVFLPSIY
jgi:hypothetical protein